MLLYNQLFWSVYPLLDHKLMESSKSVLFICLPSIIPGTEYIHSKNWLNE